MSKSTVTRLFVGGLVAMGAGIVLGLVAVVGGLTAGAITIGDGGTVEISGGALSWTIVLLVIAFIAFLGGSIAGLVSWIGALINTYELADKTWFFLLLILGLISFGFVAMIAYVFVGPDGTAQRAQTAGMTPVTHS